MRIPGNCAHCGEPLSVDDMEYWLRACERLGRDPVETALARKPPGAPCASCRARLIHDALEDGDPGAVALVDAVRRELGVGQVKH